MTSAPKAGQINSLPGTGYFTCPVCATTNVVLAPRFPVDLVPCDGCNRNWRIHETDRSFIWVPLRVIEEHDNADPAPA